MCHEACSKLCKLRDWEDADFPASDQSLGQLQGDTVAGL